MRRLGPGETSPRLRDGPGCLNCSQQPGERAGEGSSAAGVGSSVAGNALRFPVRWHRYLTALARHFLICDGLTIGESVLRP